MAMFNSYVSLPEGKKHDPATAWCRHCLPWFPLAEAVMEQQNNKQKGSLSGIPAVFQQVVFFSLLQHHANMFVVLFKKIFLQQIMYCMNLVHLSTKQKIQLYLKTMHPENMKIACYHPPWKTNGHMVWWFILHFQIHPPLQLSLPKS